MWDRQQQARASQLLAGFALPNPRQSAPPLSFPSGLRLPFPLSYLALARSAAARQLPSFPPSFLPPSLAAQFTYFYRRGLGRFLCSGPSWPHSKWVACSASEPDALLISHLHAPHIPDCLLAAVLRRYSTHTICVLGVPPSYTAHRPRCAVPVSLSDPCCGQG